MEGLSTSRTALYHRREYQEAKRAGVCVKCGEERKPGALLCKGCHDDGMRHQSARRACRLEAGLCALCGREERRPGRVLGIACASKARARYEAKRDKHRADVKAGRRSKTPHAFSALKRYRELRARGLCTRCTGASRPERSTCAGCAAYDYEVRAATDRRRYAAGLCVCGKEPRRPDRTLGVLCADKQKRRQQCKSK